MTADPIRMIEAAYRHVPTETEWLSSLLEASGAYDMGSGVVACTVSFSARTELRSIVATPGAEGTQKHIESFLGALPGRLGAAVLAPTEFVGNAAWRVNRVLAAAAIRGATSAAPAPLPPMWALTAGDGSKEALVLAFPTANASFAPEVAFPHRDSRTLGLVGAHISAALRLRGAISGSVSGTEAVPADVDDAATDAVLSPDGRVLHARGVGKSTRARTSLSEAVLRSERARGRLRKTSAEEATSLWRALVSGRWSIVELVERDGKRLLLARANSPESPERAALDPEERDVVWLVALGHSYKYVAYELGLTPSSVVRRLQRAMVKLGVANRADLLRKLGRPSPSP